MKNRNPFIPNPLERKLTKYTLWLSFIIGFFTLTNFMTHFLDTRLMIEVATTAISILVSMACLMHIHEEHEIVHRKEIRLKNKLIDKIYDYYNHLPHKTIILQGLETKLEQKSCPLQRLTLLKRYHESTAELEKFLRHVIRKHADQQILKDLGLSW